MRVRVATKEAQKLPKGWEVMVRLWLLQLAHTIYSNNISPELVVNADQTGIMLVPVGKRTYARLGAKAIRLLGIDEERQVCMCFCSYFFFVKCLRS